MNVLHTGSLRLEPLLASHAAPMFDVLTDPAIYEFENEPPSSAAALQARYARLESRVSADGSEQWLNWVVRLRSGELAGYVQATVLKNRCAYVAYELASRFWRQSIGSQAVQVVLDELAASYGVDVAYAVAKAANYRSLGLLAKLGFTALSDGAVPPWAPEADEVVFCRRLARALRIVSAGPAFELRSASAADRPALQRMLELYQHDLSDVWDQDLDGRGEYGYALDEYWSDPACQAFVILVASRYAGFALVTPRVRLAGGEHWLEQYFVVKKYRRAGIGARAAALLFDALPGAWQVGQMPRNTTAQRFWRKVIADYSSGACTETQIRSGAWHGLVQQFNSRAERSR